ncbi:hypothetical protein R5R35_014386 [Gryllus longicercus]|uniref:Uncharacterized protein n=1 Tax=Gryllus longicercus TaxID=2509291 RepID=A0AAN9Z4B6_9ORTH
MSRQWYFLAAVVLVALAVERVTQTTATGRSLTEGAPNYNNEYIMSVCPHIIRRIATPQQISGVWYLWQLLENNINTHNLTCIRYTFATEGDRLTLKLDNVLAGAVNASMNFTYIQDSNTTLWEGVGERVTAGFQMGFAADDDSVLLLCSTSVVRRPFVSLEEDIPLDMLFGREPRLDEAKMSAAVNATALAAARAVRDVETVRPPLQECSAPEA